MHRYLTACALCLGFHLPWHTRFAEGMKNLVSDFRVDVFGVDE